MHHPLATILAFAVLATTTTAQVAPGDIGVTGFSTNAFCIATPPTVTGYTTAGFGGTGAATSQAILHDPSSFNDFIVGVFGFVGRATITGPGTVSYTLITNGIGTASQMTWDNSGNIIVATLVAGEITTISPAGEILRVVKMPERMPTNICFGGADMRTAYITLSTSGKLVAMQWDEPGLRLPHG